MGRGSALGSCDEPLWTAYDVAMLDLDGVIYIGPAAVEGAAGHLAAAAESGMSLAYVTNNAARPPRSVAEHLVELGMPASVEDVVTSAQAAARLVADAVPPTAAVFVIGGLGLVEALEERGLTPVQRIEDDPVAVVSGYHPDLRWKTVIDGAILVRRGVPWFASNTDMSVPTPHGPGPGNGVLVGAVARFADVDPVVAGKPEPPLFHETQRRVGGQRPLVVGDRLDTDIEGAVRAGYDSLLVMTGVTGLAELVAAEPGARPTYLSRTLSGLGTAHRAPEEGDDGWSLGGWRATVAGGAVHVEGDGAPDDWLRVAAAAAWTHLDTHGEPPGIDGLELPPG
jgi:HAD superfamily hydrolase (TIGR01450 family)